MACKGLSDRGYGFLSDLLEAIYYAVDNGAAVINASWGGGAYAESMREALAYAADRGVLFVAAAGNNRRDIDRVPFYPAAYDAPNLVTVAASDSLDRLAYFSNYGEKAVECVAPGHLILSTVPGGGYAAYSGTSMAAPFVSGALALMRATRPGLPLYRYIEALSRSCDAKYPYYHVASWSGRLNLHGALRALLEGRRSVAHRHNRRPDKETQRALHYFYSLPPPKDN